ncbi:recombinase family protein [Paraburkholderia sp. EG287A]|uniref:recombinase family protein n=1 Tax=Paraburkholderia sp. EG287A TaxID=3237012 RepID=UPI0034D38C6F
MAYSYIRFSTGQQAVGDSLRRQLALTERYCQAHGLTLVSESIYQDLGVSAFRGKNLNSGALAEFLSAVRSGEISPGSYLIVEHFDRLSRADVDTALKLFLDLVYSGIVFITLTDEMVWDRVSVADSAKLRTAISCMSSAHDESLRLSLRISSAWDQKRKQAAQGTATRILTAEAPRWLRANTERTGFDILPALADSVQKVFEMRIKGAGSVAICRRANEEGWPLPGKATARDGRVPCQWHQSLVSRILKNRAVLGEYQPHHINATTGKRERFGEPIPGYYPAIVDELTFQQAESTADRRGQRPGRRDTQGRNWLYGLLKCGTCGSSLVRKNKPSAKQPYSRYYCSARVRGVTKCESVNSTQLENLVGYAASSWLPDYCPTDNTYKTENMIDARALRQISQEIEAIAAGRSGRDSALELREKLARVFKEIVVHQTESRIELFVEGRAEPFRLPLDFPSLRPVVETP